MKKKKIFLFLILLLSQFAFAQKGIIKGTIVDAITAEPLIGATVLIAEGTGVITDINGNFSIEADYGEYSLNVSYVGFQKITQQITLNKKVVDLKFKMETITLSEVEVVADVARERETPVAFTNILPAKIQEELASQDIPMLLNSTPGVYATQQGGGDGDARINIRGFNQRNIGVMLDGIPVNDMENGWVYWSNWFGLDMVTRSIQIQRGLGASKVAIPSVGGTLNILSKGIEAKKAISLKQEVGNDGFFRTSIGLTTGKFNNGWGFAFAGSYKWGNGFIKQTFTKGWFYFAKIEKQLSNHLISFSAMGAPQQHGQRSYMNSIATYSKDYAAKLGIDTIGVSERGLTYNEHWGKIDRYRLSDNGDTIHSEKTLNERINYYHKPQFTLKDFWQVNDKLYVSNIFYVSLGNGGGTGASPSLNSSDYTTDGQINFQKIYNTNAYGPFSIDPLYSATEHKSTKILRTSVNNHFWYGLLTTTTYRLTNDATLSGGIDLRSYKGEHYRKAYDLIGGDYYIDANDKNTQNPVKKVDDKIGYNYDGLVKWGGSFVQLEAKKDRWSAFINLSGAYSGYKRIDYFKKKDLVLSDTTFVESMGYNDTILYNGQTYTANSTEVRFSQTAWKWIPGVTVKGGANFNINQNHNIYLNLGYLSRAPRYSNVIDSDNKFFKEIKNEIVKAIELGYAVHYKKLAVNLNNYFTRWENKPVDKGISVTIDDEKYSANINGIDALHIGTEFDLAFKPISNLELQGLVSLGDWTWLSGDTVRIYDDNENLLYSQSFDAAGVHVSDAAQTQYAASIRYEIIKSLYVKGKVTYFDRYYANFDPLSLDGANARRESWQIPSYYLLDFHCGYGFKIKSIALDWSFSVINVLDNVYISDANNNDSNVSNTADFDAKSSGVFFGLGRRFNTSLKITL